jgi:hypothetical protein
MMKICAVIILLLFAAPLGEASRIFGFKPFSLKNDSQVKATPAVEERTAEKVVLVVTVSFNYDCCNCEFLGLLFLANQIHFLRI